jgi:hypothetical protein
MSAQALCESRPRLGAAKPSETTSPCTAISSCWLRCEVDHPALPPSAQRCSHALAVRDTVGTRSAYGRRATWQHAFSASSCYASFAAARKVYSGWLRTITQARRHCCRSLSLWLDRHPPSTSHCSATTRWRRVAISGESWREPLSHLSM